ncbi:MAG: hypothetical protein COW88_02835 [Candidatus Lloydbacteria bacterium CG22_combo_CG10-13_8_21_14_all_47_15]|uniref:Band 7 domain-containing protein n=1 Tax=Candidatus Lloydbacteria bacterium CG22_combo_CG10-13_8_21_14_all_47_15 TaxID=1974635 RepID=A0A2H0CTA7_9BACT|nr:MAG: hypothetical protein COW88_02835 [Candidatus Lloydbacteria bacterium CG22_combo_CG10-13_8_21_14_all_47_15]
MGLVTVLLLFVIFLALLDSFVMVPKAHYGLPILFGKRWRSEVDEGFHFRIPWAEQIELYPYELNTLQIKVKVFSMDKIEIEVEGSVQYRPDRLLLRDKYATMSENAIQIGLIDAVESELGKIAGTKDANIFVESRQELEDIINATLRCSNPPHLNPRAYEPQYAGNGDVPPDDRIAFYKKHHRQIREELEREKGHPEMWSVIELRYGFDIEVYALSKVDFTAETKKSLEEKRQAEAHVAAVDVEFKKRLSYTGKLITKGLPPQEANNAAEVALGKATRQIHSIEGVKGAIQINMPKGGDS